MKLQYFFLLLFLFGISYTSRGDATPKLHPKPELVFYQNGEIVNQFDSILIITTLEYDELLDTLWVARQFDKGFKHWDNNWIDEVWGSKNLQMVLHNDISNFQIFIEHNGKKFHSEKIEFKGVRSYLEFILTNDGKIIDDHNIFYARWGDYFIYLLVTLTLELLLVLMFVRSLGNRFKKMILLLIIATIISHSAIWFFHSHYDISLITLELEVMVFETLFITYFMAKKIWALSLAALIVSANFISWILGGFISYVISNLYRMKKPHIIM